MATPIIMPKFGQMTEESAIVEWRKQEGDKVAKGDILFTVETDKSVMDVESFEEGTLLKILVPPRVNVPVQSTVGFLGKPGEAIPTVSPPVPAAPKAAMPAPTTPPALLAGQRAPPASVVSAPVAAPVTPSPQPAAPPALFRISPRAAALARQCVIDPAPVKGTGPLGRVVERDVRQYLQSRGYDKLRVTPAAKELAAKEGVDLLGLVAGVEGRISLAEVQRAIAEKPKAMSKMRQIIAQRLTQSFRDIPHFYVTVPVDMSDLIAYRNVLKAAGAPYTVTDFISQAVVLCLLEFPTVNSSTDGRTIRWHSQVNLGLAVSIEGGLVVPVIPDAGRLTLTEISATSKQLADKARAGKLTPDEMSGGTFTISNMGMLNIQNFSAIINPGEGAILAVASTLPQPVVREDKILIRQIMQITLSLDHRLIDGALGAQFINAIRSKLEDIELWKRLTS
ncbi:MAG: dihydrolipoamide acetyltransferase family protein [Verrucomicrobiota bacterium]|jgi:pyruvate dehydrogenase E2 component (dihydrolipoamide acetyltransferase)